MVVIIQLFPEEEVFTDPEGDGCFENSFRGLSSAFYDFVANSG